MDAGASVTPENTVAGTMLAQLSVLGIMTLAALVIRREQSLFRWSRSLPSYAAHGWVILILALLSLGGLVLSDGFAATWRPLFRTLGYAGWRWSSAVEFAFVVDVVALTILVAGTGGSIRSPFQPLYFLMPTLALFLRESTGRVILYAAGSGLSFLLLLLDGRRGDDPEVDDTRHRLAYGLVSLLCLGAACFIGVFTRST